MQFGDHGESPVPDSPNTQVTWAYNLSAGGVGLNCSVAMEVGQDVLIRFRVQGKDTAGIPAHIIFCRLEVDSTWRLGCQFMEPISQDMLDTLLG